ncbi:alpha/beta-hydrolase [Mycena sp. CBHHK59/15]|nr:alpha/beta-hydrolase [Mycena sp. CBHHK59/15]
MRDAKFKPNVLLPQQQLESQVEDHSPLPTWPSSRNPLKTLVIVASFLASVFILWSRQSWDTLRQNHDSFYAKITTPPQSICPVSRGPGISYSGHIGLRGDSDSVPKRSFFWYFEAEEDAEDAPIILTFGGGPGTSGMLSPMSAQGPCVAVENGTAVNPNRWTEHFNFIALDHPIGVGFSYGTRVNNSRDAAIDVYDFLQKFFHLFPHLIGNPLILSGGSYGGIYVPHIATVIHEKNAALVAGNGPRGAIHINLESMMVSNPVSDATSYYRWMLHTRCYDVDMYNASTCAELFAVLPACLESIQLAQQGPGWSVEKHVAAQKVCMLLENGDRHGTVIEDVRKKCYSTEPLACLPPSFGWSRNFFNRSDVRDALGIPEHVNFNILSDDVTTEFRAYGDKFQPAYLLYEPLLRDGIRLLHYVGAQDANCAWRGVISFLKLLQSPFQDEFLRAPDVPWPTADDATVRVVGPGAGNMTYILVAQGGHFVARDQPALVKSIVDHWVPNVPFVSS